MRLQFSKKTFIKRSFYLVSDSSFFSALACFCLGFFFYSPRFILYLGTNLDLTRRDILLLQCVNPFNQDLPADPVLIYRLAQPFLAHVLNLCGSSSRDMWSLLAAPGLAYIALFLSLYFSHLVFKKRIGSLPALLAVAGMSLTHITHYTFFNWGVPDSFVLLPVVILMRYLNPYTFFLCSFLGILADERFLMAVPFIFLWWIQPGFTPSNCKPLLRRMLSAFTALLLALILYSIFRYCITIGFFFGGSVSVSPYEENFTLFTDVFSKYLEPEILFVQFPVLVFFGLKSLWIIVILGLFAQLCTPNFKYLCVFLFFLSFAIIVMGLTTDFLRNFVFIFPAYAIAICSCYANKDLFPWRINKLFAFALMLAALTPSIKPYFGTPIEQFGKHVIYPLPANLYRFFTHPTSPMNFDSTS